MDWKRQAIIAEAEAKLKADPGRDAPRPEIDPKRDRLLRVVADRLDLERAESLHVLISRLRRLRAGFPGHRADGTARATGHEPGRRIMVDLGFVPERLKSLARPRSRPACACRNAMPRDNVVGLLYWPDETDGWTPEPDLDREHLVRPRRHSDGRAELWHRAGPADRRERTPDGGSAQLPRPPGVDIPNRHLEYVLTWYGAGAGLGGSMSVDLDAARSVCAARRR